MSFLNQSNILIPMNALFLDIRESVGKITNGVLIKVKKKDLEKMDIKKNNMKELMLLRIFFLLSLMMILYIHIKEEKSFFQRIMKI